MVLLILAAAGIYAFIKPSHQLNLNYEEVDWKTKLLTIVQTRETALTLSEEDINHLAKKGIAERLAASSQPYRIEGADFRLNGDELSADIIAKRGFIRGEGTAVYKLSFQEGKLRMDPKEILIHGKSLSPSLFKLETIEVDPGLYLPELIQITGITFGEHQLKVEFAVNWLQLPGLLE